MSDAKIILKWINAYFKVNGIYPTAFEIIAQLQMAIDEEESRDFDCDYDSNPIIGRSDSDFD